MLSTLSDPKIQHVHHNGIRVCSCTFMQLLRLGDLERVSISLSLPKPSNITGPLAGRLQKSGCLALARPPWQQDREKTGMLEILTNSSVDSEFKQLQKCSRIQNISKRLEHLLDLF